MRITTDETAKLFNRILRLCDSLETAEAVKMTNCEDQYELCLALQKLGFVAFADRLKKQFARISPSSAPQTQASKLAVTKMGKLQQQEALNGEVLEEYAFQLQHMGHLLRREDAVDDDRVQAFKVASRTVLIYWDKLYLVLI
jgi:hypothetical protein